MESLVYGAVWGVGLLVLYFVYFIIKDLEGWKGKVSRSVFYTFIAAVLLLLWANNPDKFESLLTWGVLALAGWYCLKIILEQWQSVSERRQKDELARYQNIMAQLEIIKSRLEK